MAGRERPLLAATDRPHGGKRPVLAAVDERGLELESTAQEQELTAAALEGLWRQISEQSPLQGDEMEGFQMAEKDQISYPHVH